MGRQTIGAAIGLGDGKRHDFALLGGQFAGCQPIGQREIGVENGR
jgi:hypothetical protein